MLIFLSGMTDIAALLLETREYAQKTGHWIVLPLHSALSVEEQDRVSEPYIAVCVSGWFNRCSMSLLMK